MFAILDGKEGIEKSSVHLSNFFSKYVLLVPGV